MKPNLQKFAEILNDHSLEQVVEDPTREKNVLDLFVTNISSKVNRIEVIPGVSDHCVPLMELDVSPVKRKQAPMKVYQYKKAAWDRMSNEL